MGALMRTVSFQGATLSASERRSLELRRRAMAATLQALEQHKEQGGKPEKVWSTISNEKGTPFLGDVFGWP